MLTVTDVYLPDNRASKKMTELKRKIEKFTITAGDFNTTFLTGGRTTNQK